MKLSKLKQHLNEVESVNFKLEDGSFVPDHFHVTEVGIVSKHFIDCGGTVRNEKVASLQLWDADDYDHRLKPQKLLNIIGLSEKVLGLEDLEIEVEYQARTIGKYHLGFDGHNFLLLPTLTDCLSKDNCGIPQKKQKIKLSGNEGICCTSEGNCC